MAISARKAKKLSELAQRMFEELVGNPPNHNFKFHSREEVLFAFSALEAMVSGYVSNMGDDKIPPKEMKSEEHHVGTNSEGVYVVCCPFCRNREIDQEDRFCKICGNNLRE